MVQTAARLSRTRQADRSRRRLSRRAHRAGDWAMKAEPHSARDRLNEAQEQRRKQHREGTGTAPKGKYMRGKTSLACNAGNVLLALQTEPELKGAFGYDEMQRTEVLLRPLFGDDPNFKPRPGDRCRRHCGASASAMVRLPSARQRHHASSDRQIRARESLSPDPRLSQRPGMGRHRTPAGVAACLSRCRQERLHREHRRDVSDRHGRPHLAAGMQARLHDDDRGRSGCLEI